MGKKRLFTFYVIRAIINAEIIQAVIPLKKLINTLLLLCLLLTLPVLARAEEARDVTKECTCAQSTGFSNPGSVLDEKLWSVSISATEGGAFSVTAPEGLGSAYLLFDEEYGEYTVTDDETGTAVTVDAAGILHHYLDLEALFGRCPQALTFRFEAGQVRIADLYLFTPGQVPDWVQRWEKPVEDGADLVLFSTHCDDEQLFFAGVLPYYAGELGCRVQVVYLTNHRNLTHIRCHEALNGLWAVGVRNYPVFGSFADYFAKSEKDELSIFSQHDVTQEDLLGYVTEQLRRFRPLVALGHDLNGEYGHGAHMLYADLLTQALEAAADESRFPESARRYGVWDTPKTYLHLYEENPIVMDWDRPLSRFDGMSAYQVTKQLGFPCHASQTEQYYWYFNWNLGTEDHATDIRRYSPCNYGLYRSTVGEDVEKNDFFENLLTYDQQAQAEAEAKAAEEARLAAGCVGVRRTTGQHPGGLVVIPQENEIWDFCPVQHPADDPNADQITTHFEYHSMEENLLKLDMLGHDDPTMIRMMEDMTGVDAKTIPLDDKNTMSIFTSSKVLGYENDKILGPTGAVAIPEFNTKFTRGMLMDTMPERFDTLLRLSGFSHGTDVWLGNAKDLITSKTATVDQAIGCRDDIMLYLISCGMPEKRSFKIMEAVRKGRGLPEGAEQEMIDAGVPDWYIGSCKKIKYLFPKAHAVAYVMMAFRIAWFKVYHPLAFYAAYFYRRSQKGGFDAVLMTQGMEAIMANMDAIETNENASDKDEDLLTTMEVVYEYYLRGFEFLPIDIYKSHATKFLVEDGKILPPFVAISGLGENAAWDLMRGREGKTFLSIEEVAAACPKVSKTHIQMLKDAGAFGSLPDTSQISLF